MCPPLKEFIDIYPGFQYSVNLQYDINNIDKINDFIPTTSSLNIIEKIFYSTNPKSTSRATMFVGAYGKGKSHIALVLLSLLSNAQPINQYEPLIKKLTAINPTFGNQVTNYLNSKTKLLPVIISGSSTSLTQSFLNGLKNALDSFDLQKLMPNTHFTAAVNMIELWQEKYPETYQKLCSYIKKDISHFIQDLKAFDIKSYEEFEKIYTNITSGGKFNPYDGIDVIELYSNVLDKLKDYGYSGIFTIYDEFSKYLETTIANASISDIKLLQDFAEKCNRSGNKQLHLMLISHKDLSNYIDKKIAKEKIDGWSGVSGRFETIYLHNNFEQAYDIIEQTITHQNGHNQLFSNRVISHLDDSIKEDILSDLAAKLNQKDNNVLTNLLNKVYPLHPISLYILPRLSEKIAQNERTLFTFLASNNKYTLSYYLETHHLEDTRDILLTPDLIFDYFETTLQRESYYNDIYKQYNMARKIIEKLQDGEEDSSSLEIKIIKTISLITMLGDFTKLEPTISQVQNIYLLAGYETSLITTALKSLIDKSYLIYLKRSNGHLLLKEFSSVDLKNKIAQTKANLSLKLRYQDLLNRFVENYYVYPHRHNDINELTRYFKVLFVSIDDLRNQNTIMGLLNNPYIDGYFLPILNEKNEDLNLSNIVSDYDINCKLEKVVLSTVKESANIYDLILEYAAVKELSENENDPIIISEYTIIISDLEEVISKFINDFLLPEHNKCTIQRIVSCDGTYTCVEQDIRRKSHLSALLSDICDTLYDQTPTINNEMINKHNLSGIAFNSRAKIISALLNISLEPNLGFEGYGQEVSIMRSILISPNIIRDIETKPYISLDTLDLSLSSILESINDFILASEDAPRSFGELYSTLTGTSSHYKLKYGVIPIYLATVMHIYFNNITIIYNNEEIEVTADTLAKINDNPNKYFLSYTRWQNTTEEYIVKMLETFSDYFPKQKNLSSLSITDLANALNRWYLGLPKLAKNTKLYFTSNNLDPISISPQNLKLLNSLKKIHANPRNFILHQIPDICSNGEITTDTHSNFIKIKTFYDKYTMNLKLYLIARTRMVFNNSENTSLYSAITDWSAGLHDTTIEHVFSKNYTNVLKTILSISTDNLAFIETLSKNLTGLYIEDWDLNTINVFFEELNSFITEVEEYNQQEIIPVANDELLGAVRENEYKLIANINGINTVKTFEHVEYSARAKLFANMIDSAIDEMGAAISVEEKRQVLLNILANL